MSENCEMDNCVLCNPCSYCGGTADLFYPYGQIVTCIECVKDGELEGASV
jgi:hypothetical protein